MCSSDLGYTVPAVYRERETGALYISRTSGIDITTHRYFENAVDYVSFFVYPGGGDDVTAEERAEIERRSSQVNQEIDARFEVYDSLEFPAVDGEDWCTDIYWLRYWNGYRGYNDVPDYPPFHASVEEVRQSLSAP